MPKGYVIAIRDELRDEAEMKAYAEKSKGTFTSPVRPLAAYGRLETLEGKPADGVVILEFENYDAAKSWYESPAYQAAMMHRLNGADYRLILTEGL